MNLDIGKMGFTIQIFIASIVIFSLVVRITNNAKNMGIRREQLVTVGSPIGIFKEENTKEEDIKEEIIEEDKTEGQTIVIKGDNGEEFVLTIEKR